MSIRNAAIIGAGMAGLTTALALSNRGIRCHVIEQAPYLAEVGAGLQISPNASRILARLGVLSALEREWTEPERIALVSGKSLGRLGHVPAGRFARERWRAPYGVAHRSTLQRVLMDAVVADRNAVLHLGRRIDRNNRDVLADLIGEAPDVIVGADGVWSSTRDEIAAAPEPDFSRNVAWRFTLASRDAPSFLQPDTVTAYLGPSCHLVCYPLREIDGFNIVAIAAGLNPGEIWEANASIEQKRLLLEQFGGWHPQIVSLLKCMDSGRFWPLYQVSDGAWQNGRDTVLVGDAAHAMMPFAAQGAAMAIEDGWELAMRLSTAATVPQALADYEKVRKARAARVRARGAFNRFAYHVRGPLRIGRDMVLALRPPQALAADLDWLYGYDATT
ncbi:salicylate hydroxylase [Rhizobium sp. RU35A]|uniref:FAD-binding protein n=1 Tax=Rhizobium straminoryzae TaxID=1387186 RepID=A0A549TG26_9HYPH|nr:MULTISPECIES: FAD-dependent monooxygenase [Rhizobium]TRL41537.1 FAD-binding protein [Rhizobium straminoryzae]SIQ78978.1 salicylate hydroxylase [Rhizobium sp. RU35A]